MKIGELEKIFGKILARTERIVKGGGRSRIFNEEFFHHQFSHYVASHYARSNVDAWQRQILIPKHPTRVKYSWKDFNLNRPKTTQKFALDRGQRGYFDFVIRDDPRVHVEWAGPKLYTPAAVAQDLTELLMLEGRGVVKIFAAIITSSTTADENHVHQLQSRFYQALEFVEVVLDIDDMRRENLYAFIATVPDSGSQKFIWGKV
jgi:hypothetical protein